MTATSSVPADPDQPTTKVRPAQAQLTIPGWWFSAGGIAALVAPGLLPWVVSIPLGCVVVMACSAALIAFRGSAGLPRGHPLAGLATSAVAVVVVVVSLSISVQWPSLALLNSQPPAAPSTLRVSSVSASAVAAPSKDAGGAAVTFDADNLVDGDVGTAWRVDGRGVGTMLTFNFDPPVQVATMHVLPGYAKVDPLDGSDRWAQNGRVTSVRLTASDGRSDVVALNDAPNWSMLTLGSTVNWVRMEIVGSAPGQRNFTAMSEVVFVGTTAG